MAIARRPSSSQMGKVEAILGFIRDLENGAGEYHPRRAGRNLPSLSHSEIGFFAHLWYGRGRSTADASTGRASKHFICPARLTRRWRNTGLRRRGGARRPALAQGAHRGSGSISSRTGRLDRNWCRKAPAQTERYKAPSPYRRISASDFSRPRAQARASDSYSRDAVMIFSFR